MSEDNRMKMIYKAAAIVSKPLYPRVTARELWGAGWEGYISAQRLFDKSYDVPFNAYAYRRVKGAMLDYLRTMDHLPRSARAKVVAFSKTEDKLTQELQREPSLAEIEVASDLSSKDVKHICECTHLLSIDYSYNSDQDNSGMLRNVIEDKKQDLRHDVEDALSKFYPDSKLLLKRYFIDGLTMGEIAKERNMSETRICQLIIKLVGKTKERQLSSHTVRRTA